MELTSVRHLTSKYSCLPLENFCKCVGEIYLEFSEFSTWDSVTTQRNIIQRFMESTIQLASTAKVSQVIRKNKPDTQLILKKFTLLCNKIFGYSQY